MNLDDHICRIIDFEERDFPADSDWYGLGPAMLDWLGLPADTPLNAILQHGAMLDDIAHYFYGSSPLRLYLARQGTVDLYLKQYGKLAYATGTMYVNYRRHNGIEQADDAVGTIAFPAHSTHHLGAVYDIQKYIGVLKSLPEAMQPVTVCLYWKNLLDGAHLPYLDAGFEVVTAGHMFDTEFCKRFYNLLRRFRYATGNEVGTQTILALEMGMTYIANGEVPSIVDLTGKTPEWWETIKDRIGENGVIRKLPRGAKVEILCRLNKFDQPVPFLLKQLVSAIHGSDEPIDKERLRASILNA